MVAIFVIAALIGLTWGAVLLRRGNLLAGCLLVLAAGCCFSHPFWLVRLAPRLYERLMLRRTLG